jgi:hypothetical protein
MEVTYDLLLRLCLVEQLFAFAHGFVHDGQQLLLLLDVALAEVFLLPRGLDDGGSFLLDEFLMGGSRIRRIISENNIINFRK